MPQVFQVLLCYNCDMFQVHQIKKSNKWACKVCNEKQSLKKAFKIGCASDCRSLVQELNMQRGTSKLASNSDNWQEEDSSSDKEEHTDVLNESTFEMSEENFNDACIEESNEIRELPDTTPHISHQSKNFDKIDRPLPKSMNVKHVSEDEHDLTRVLTNDLTSVSNTELCSKQTINTNLKNFENHQKRGLECNSAGYSQLGNAPAFKKHCGFQRILDAASKLN